MKIITNSVLSALLIGGIGIIGYSNYYEPVAKTSPDAPNTVDSNGKKLSSMTILKNKLDATSNIRKAQANADIRAREQRHRYFTPNKPRNDRDLQSEVRSKLEMNLPTSSLAVQSDKGIITVAGMLETANSLNRIHTLAQEINGVKGVEVRAIAISK